MSLTCSTLQLDKLFKAIKGKLEKKKHERNGTDWFKLSRQYFSGGMKEIHKEFQSDHALTRPMCEPGTFEKIRYFSQIAWSAITINFLCL
jgi:hypothetical protein